MVQKTRISWLSWPHAYLGKIFYLTNSFTTFPTDWRDAPECVWLHPHRWPSGVQTPATLGHVSSPAPGDISTPGQPVSCRDWWVADTLLDAGYRLQIYLLWQEFFASSFSNQWPTKTGYFCPPLLLCESVILDFFFFHCLSGEDFVVSSLFHSTEAGGIPPELSCFLNRCFIARVRCLLDSTSGFLVSTLRQTATET